jgi:hypothetical protein
MVGPVRLLALSCIVLGVGSPLVVGLLEPAIAAATALSRESIAGAIGAAETMLWAMVAACAGVALVAGVLAIVRRGLLARRSVTVGPTWDCGYAAPSARMQYTGSSFSQPLTSVFARVLDVETNRDVPMELFPTSGSFAIATRDLAHERGYRPAFAGLRLVLARLRWLQHGEVQLYVLYIALTLVALLLWAIAP